MVGFFIGGGWIMFVLLALGVTLIVTAVKFAIAATPQRLALIRALTVAIVFALIAGVTSDLATVCKRMADNDEWLKTPLPYLLEGIGESLAPAIFGASLAVIGWILVALGVRRMPAAGDAL